MSYPSLEFWFYCAVKFFSGSVSSLFVPVVIQDSRLRLTSGGFLLSTLVVFGFVYFCMLNDSVAVVFCGGSVIFKQIVFTTARLCSHRSY